MTNTQKKIEELRHKYYGANNPKIEDILIDVTKALQDTREETIKDVEETLATLVDEIGYQVTRDYTIKSGIWEGRSVCNQKSLKKAINKLTKKK